MSIPLRTYMVKLAIDPDALTRFISDPEGAAEAAGISEQDRTVLFSGNQHLIYQRLAFSDGTSGDSK